ncbi:VLRF1 family aeRF1-type release factor [Gracilibacillus xinjiangensis]|uniref:VLRF1 family aeRF1-type release factor n=1 Tax=Gracilibacillus xinjiangensis TaxID=1193282 RepID=A0ABV8WR75_9BACI
MNIHEKIKELSNVQLGKPNRIFTMYLNTDRADPEQQGGEWKIHLKNGLRNFESYLKEDGDSDEKRNYWAVKEKVEKYMNENEQNLAKSVVIFATGDDSIWFAEKFQLPVTTEFEWDDYAHLDQLKKMYESFPKSGIILTQKAAVKVLDTELGTLKDSHTFELDLDTEDWREYSGPPRAQASTVAGGKNTQQDQFKERFDANRYRWYKTLASTLDRFAKGLNWENIYIVGDKDEVNDLKVNMNKPVTKVVNKNMLDHEEMKVIDEVVKV